MEERMRIWVFIENDRYFTHKIMEFIAVFLSFQWETMDSFGSVTGAAGE
jgi:hypothetical protein